MLHTIISLDDVLYNKSDDRYNIYPSSTNPFKYINDGYYIDDLEYFGGENNVSFKCDIYGNFAGNH